MLGESGVSTDIINSMFVQDEHKHEQGLSD